MSRALAIMFAMCTTAAHCAEPAIEVISTRVIAKQPGRYIGWPTIERRKNGELVAVFSGDRQEHICPFGKVQMIRSNDEGKTWSAPQTIQDLPAIDDRDAGITEAADGALVVTWFTSTYFADHVDSCRKMYGEAVVSQWKESIAALTPETRTKLRGNWTVRSTDGGQTWEAPVKMGVTAPHGCFRLADGTLAYLGNAGVNNDLPLELHVSTDNGKSWSRRGSVPVPPEKARLKFCEPHGVETSPGKLLGLFRVESGKAEEQFVYTAFSSDAGATWTVPEKTNIWGYPPHALRLKNGWILLSYGRRKAPVGERACISKDEGKTWGEEFELCRAPNSDLGYPASVELSDGSIYTIYYQLEKAGEKTCLMATHWRLKN
ncbi:MAG TPA: sialidase family protein [Planctomycetota bacterium]|nr:sialidase family protein [Planctomycetota bacterium]